MLVVLCAELPLKGRRIIVASERLSLPLHIADVPVYHREELDRIYLLALEPGFHVKDLIADTHRLPGTDFLTVSCEDVREMAVYHLVIPIASS